MYNDFDMEQIFIDFNEIETIQDLKKNKLKHSDYLALADTLNDFYHNSEAFTFIESVKNWCVKKGLRAEKKDHGWILF